MRSGAKQLFVFALLGLLAGCSDGGDALSPIASVSKPPDSGLGFDADPPSEFDLLPGWRSDAKSETVAAFAAGCRLIADHHYDRACQAASKLRLGDETVARAFLRDYFRPQSLGSDLLTGYTEFTINGSRQQSADYPVPVYAAPRDAKRYSRAEIMGGALDGQRLELFYLPSEMELYALQTLGEARVMLPDGGQTRVAVVANNGRPKANVDLLFGDALIPGEDLSLSSLRNWAADRVPQANGHLARDPFYAFFREQTELAPQYGPYGKFTLPLLRMRSVAIDPKTTALGGMLWINASRSPDAAQLPHLVIAHDSAPDIVGPARMAMFFGWGASAEQLASRQHARVEVWSLVPR